MNEVEPDSFDKARDRLESFRDRVYWLVRRIPEGDVATYGQIAFYAGSYGAARAVGNLMRNSLKNDEDVPWQRVVNAKGAISVKGDTARAELQRRLLRMEGLEFTGEWSFDLSDYEWEPAMTYWGEALHLD